jgi:hypothetical protein
MNISAGFRYKENGTIFVSTGPGFIHYPGSTGWPVENVTSHSIRVNEDGDIILEFIDSKATDEDYDNSYFTKKDDGTY